MLTFKVLRFLCLCAASLKNGKWNEPTQNCFKLFKMHARTIPRQNLDLDIKSAAFKSTRQFFPENKITENHLTLCQCVNWKMDEVGPKQLLRKTLKLHLPQNYFTVTHACKIRIKATFERIVQEKLGVSDSIGDGECIFSSKNGTLHQK